MVLVIGGGPAGLAVGGALRALGRTAHILDRAAEVGATWKGHYDRLHLHSARWLSDLPGKPIPRADGPWVARDRFVAYLEDYARGLDIEHGVDVTTVARDEDGWRLETSAGPREATHVVVATGYNRVPLLPDGWPGSFTGELLHASRYKTGAAYRGKDVLVVGGGNTGAELAIDLVEQGASRVRISLRTPPNIVPRAILGFPTQALTALVLQHLPAKVVDGVSKVVGRITVGDLSPYGILPAPKGTFTRASEDGQIPILDLGFVDLVKARKIEVVRAVTGFDRADVLLADDTRIQPEVVVAATGYRRGLEPLVGHLGLLDERGRPRVHGAETDPGAPGLYFIGFSNPVKGNLLAIKEDAEAIARTVA